MKQNQYIISQEQLDYIGITPEEIEQAGGFEAIAHIVWFFQNTKDYSDDAIDKAIQNAFAKRQEEELLKKSFDDIPLDDDTQDNTDINHHNNNSVINSYLLNEKPILIDNNDGTFTIKQLYEKNWGRNPHPALKLMLEAYFIDVQEIIPDKDDKKEILKTVHLLRSYVAGKDLPIDAEDERLIVYAREMYKEFLETKSDYQNCPIAFLLDEHYEDFPEKYRMLIQSLPVSAILKIFSENCFYDSDTHTIEEALPEEVNIKNLCDMIEKLAVMFKIWQ